MTAYQFGIAALLDLVAEGDSGVVFVLKEERKGINEKSGK